MDDMKIFVPITKIDAAQRLVYGVVTAEAPDVAGEVCDYASTKPLYQKWSANFASATDGKSFGNLRAMHGNVAAGKLVDIAFNDEQRRIEICGKVVDDDEWQKVEEGVYTGFSQGGRYLKRWPDPDRPSLTRYTAQPLEISLVDFPCLPEATFAVVKADGSTELRKFKIGAPQLDLLPLSPASGGVKGGGVLAGALGKIGARHSKADKERIKNTHDILVALDPDCCAAAAIPGASVNARPELSPQAGEGANEDASEAASEAASEVDDPEDNAKLAKMLDRAVDRRLASHLAKTLGSINARFDKLTSGMDARFDKFESRVKKIEDQPLPLGTSSVRVAEKSEDAIVPRPETLLDRPGALEALADAAIRKAQAQPMRAIPGFRPREG